MADNNLITKSDLARVREIEFVSSFGKSIAKLMEALGTTRKIPKQAGAALKAYKTTGTLAEGTVGEGETIPLSKYKTEAVLLGEITLKKWRKATTAEAVIDRGYDQAVDATTAEMLKDVQKTIRKDFFDFLGTGTGRTRGDTFQAALAQAWGQLQVFFDDDGVACVYFMNPLDVADYLATAPITMQTAFGMSYAENFLGLGTVIFNGSVPKGKIYATAKDNLVLYYIPVGGANLDEIFTFTADDTGYIGIHEQADYTNMTSGDTVVCGMKLLADKMDGIVVADIGPAPAPTIGKLTVSSGEGTSEGKTKLTVTEGKLDAANGYKYHLGDHADDVVYGQNVRSWTAWDGSADIDAATGQTLTLVECDKEYKAVAVGSCSVTAKAGE